MYDHNQTLVPDSFLALYTRNSRPTLERRELEARYEACEDLALHVAELCRNRQQGVDDAPEALHHCYDGLIAPPLSTPRPEAVWVVRRVAELLEWPVPGWVDSAGE
ncbi:hypothetical protein [Piscinibacter koreensis]|uniref:ATPase with chaperone activity n=1 Tax=Piscinibacter koreensis TaxID=2742824 RepID=A0A7Y6TY38_9BURK|nr:hypothetical protein [Schlegelella koreensis]NUZ07789.1 hypothetical protein [Schlegelella koreensis]